MPAPVARDLFISIPMQLRLVVLVAFSLVGRTAGAQLATAPDANPLGTWRGTSRCVAGAATCKDEVVVYRVRKATGDSLSVDARRVVDGREQDTALYACELNAPRAYITCVIPAGKWRFRVRHDSLVGQLRLHNGTWLRDVHALRSREGIY